MKRNYANQKKLVFIKCNDCTRQIKIEEITHIECCGCKSFVYLRDNETAICSTKSLKIYEEELIRFNFLRVNRNALINARYISSFQNNYSNIVLHNNKCFEVSRRRKHLLKEIDKFPN